MSVVLASVKVKAGVVSFGDYVTAKGAGTLADVGLTQGGVTIAPKVSHRDIEGDQHLGVLSKVPIKRELELKFTMAETDATKLMLATEQPAANKTGTPPNLTVSVDANAVEQYHQMKLSIPGGGVGTTGLREMTFYRTVVVSVEPIPYKKDVEQTYAVTVAVLQEISGTGSDSFYKQVDT